MGSALDPDTEGTVHQGTTPEQGRTARYRTVVVPVAGTPDARVLAVAADVARALGVEAQVIAIASLGLEALDDAQIRRDLATLRRSMEVRIVLDDGDVPGALLAAAAEDDALLCLSTNATAPIGELLFGSVGADVIRRSQRELLAIGPRCRDRLSGTKMLVAVDGSAGGATIVPAALDLAARAGLCAQLVEVILSPATPGVVRRAQLEQLARLVQAHERVDHEPEPLLLHGSRVDETLVELSGAPDVAMLAMSTHGIGRLERLFVGSIALDVIRRARCPVLVGPRSAGAPGLS